MTTSKTLWGIDLGGTKIEGVIIRSGDSPEILHRIRVPTEQEKGYDHIVAQIQVLFKEMQELSGEVPKHVGIGTPGTIDPGTSLLKNSNTVCLNGQPLQKDVEATLGIEVRMANDANCFALAESIWGAGKGKDSKVFFGVIMGTGVGGGLVVNGTVIGGLHGIAGEWGHMHLDNSGGDCYCGSVGCVERIISGTSVERYYTSLSGENTKLKEILKRREAGDPHAIKAHERLIHFYGLGLSKIINLLDPDMIVLGGGLSNIPSLYTEGREAIKKTLFNKQLDTPILPPLLGDSAGVFGAALL